LVREQQNLHGVNSLDAYAQAILAAIEAFFQGNLTSRCPSKDYSGRAAGSAITARLLVISGTLRAAFLTFKPKTGPEKGHRGLSSAPIVPIPGSDNVALV
jgi:hypothetical protein